MLALLLASAGFAPRAGAEESSEGGRVIHIADGDTFTFDYGDGRVIRVRNTGINALESWEPCRWDEQAERRLSALILGKYVTLTAQDANARSMDRYWRWVSTVEAGDVSLRLLTEGLAFPFPHRTEFSKNREYLRAGAAAAEAKRGIWAGDVCHPGPEASLRLWVNWDADGSDERNVNGEYVRIRNYGSEPLPVGGWWVRDSGTNRYWRFPDGAMIPARGYVTVHMGRGTNAGTTFFAGWTGPVFANVIRSIGMGDGAFLFDPDGDLRAFMMYPCVRSCVNPLKGRIAMSVDYDAAGSDQANPNGEWVKIRNVSTRPVYLSGFVLDSPPYVYDFYRRGLSSRISPGETMTVFIGKGRSTRLRRYWGKADGILNNLGDIVRLRTFDAIPVACRAWGSGRC